MRGLLCTFILHSEKNLIQRGRTAGKGYFMFQVGDCIAHPMHGAGVIDGIEEIEDIKDSEGLNDLNVATFDLFGRRVSSLRPGTIYLRNGKKFIFGK